jgi:restriction system protein
MAEQAELPKVWVIRAGRHGEDEEAALAAETAIVSFREFDDLAKYGSVAELAEHFLKLKPNAPRRRAENYARQLWALREKIHIGDVAVLPLKTRSGQIAVGRVTGPYRYAEVRGEKRHTRAVEWVHPDLPRSTFGQDLLYSFGAFITVCRVQRNDAERRLQTILAGRPDPGQPEESLEVPEPGLESDEAIPSQDLAQAASDQIIAFIRRRFPGHDMARLVEAVLQAEGFLTERASPGPDGGADILAGRGPLGLDEPFLCVQVKAAEEPIDVKVFRELAGTMAAFKATQGLLVSWGGFKQTVLREARQEAFKIRLWDQASLVGAVFRSYEKLSPEIQPELPLKQGWMLVPEEEGSER